MEEKKKEEEQTHEKAFWIIGIAIILFLVLLFGSIILLRIVQNGANSIVDKVDNLPNGTIANYTVLEDGTKQNTNSAVTGFETEIAGRKLSSFNIEELNGLSTVSVNISNVTDSRLDTATLMVKLYNGSDELITAFAIIIDEIEAGKTSSVTSSILRECADTARIEIEEVK